MQPEVNWTRLRHIWLQGMAAADDIDLACHPFSGERRPGAVRPDRPESEHIPPSNGLDDRSAFLELWRLAPDFAADAWGAGGNWLSAGKAWRPASLWDHLEYQVRTEIGRDQGEPQALLSVALGPVQPFIAAARSLRDLWTGSTLLSWLAFQAIRPLIDRFGPTCLLFPVLRGNPLVDVWLREQGCEHVPMPSPAALRTPGLPHRILAVVPWGEGTGAAEMGQACVSSARTALADVSAMVRQKLDPDFAALHRDWADRWDAQIDTMLDASVVVSPLTIPSDRLAALLGAPNETDLWPERSAAAAYVETSPGGPSAQLIAHAVATDWPARIELAARMLEAARATRPVPATPADPQDLVPMKCTLLGTWEQVGPADRHEAARFWQAAVDRVRVNGVRLRRGERFCAQSLLKRFAMPAGLGDILGLDRDAMRFPDTATIAASDWMNDVGLQWRDLEVWSGQWLYRDRDDQDPDETPPPAVQRLVDEALRRAMDLGYGAPPTYYAVIQCDGDTIGEWLRGAFAPPLTAFADAGEAGSVPGDIHVPAGPLWHAMFSRALADFATGIAPRVVKHHGGTLIYAGGDDVLAVLPARRALACAYDLRRLFSGYLGGLNAGPHEGWVQFASTREYLTLGPAASLSAGICIAHAKQDLRSVLQAVREAEGAAKSAGRDAVGIMAMRRSGEHALAVADWQCMPWLMDFVGCFGNGASDRWAYGLRSVAETLAHLPEAAVLAEIRRQVDRCEGAGPLAGGESADGTPGARVANLYAAFDMARRKRCLDGPSLTPFLTLCQTASFMARGRDR